MDERAHQCSVSQRRGAWPVASYRYTMTCQICCSSSRSSHGCVAEEQRDDDEEPEPDVALVGLHERRPDRVNELAPGVGVGGDVDQHREQDDRHVKLDDAPRRGRADTEAQDDEGGDEDQDRLDEARPEEVHFRVRRNATRSTYSFAVSVWPKIGGMTPFG